ncbi:hypothetical protein SNEBB_001112 [Seison nebaliae]|nr:hypothetical protein SNEBB_001112 [Seison nebaliae]
MSEKDERLEDESPSSMFNIHYSDEEFGNLSTYKAFAEFLRPHLDQNLSTAQKASMIGSEWKLFQVKQEQFNLSSRKSNGEEADNHGTVPPLKIRISPTASKDKLASKRNVSINDGIIEGKRTRRAVKTFGTLDSTDESVPTTTTNDKQKRHSKRRTKNENDVSDAEFEAMLEEYSDRSEKNQRLRKANLAKNRRNNQKRRSARHDKTSENGDDNYQKREKDVETSESQEFCEVCTHGGEIMLCDTCPKAYHLYCLSPELDAAPEGEWSCPKCVTSGRCPSQTSNDTEIDGSDEEMMEVLPQSKKQGDKHKPNCFHCKLKEHELLRCASCNVSAHAWCVWPPIETIPEIFYCPRCVLDPPKYPVQRILNWRFALIPSDDEEEEEEEEEDEEEDNEEEDEGEVTEDEEMETSEKKRRKVEDETIMVSDEDDDVKMKEVDKDETLKEEEEEEKEEKKKEKKYLQPPENVTKVPHYDFFVKYRNMSYWYCDWISDVVMDKYHSTILRSHLKKFDLMRFLRFDLEGNIDPEEMVVADGQIHHKTRHNDSEIEKKYVRNGVRPAWLSIGRILNHRKLRKMPTEYYLKWKEMSYEFATYEPENGFIHKSIPEEWKAAKERYWTHRNLMCDKKSQIQPISHKRHKGSSSSRQTYENKTIGKRTLQIAYNNKLFRDPINNPYKEQPKYLDDGTLHEYQLTGINWLRYSWAKNINVVLADEMGLGKTVQTVTFLYSLFKEGLSKGPFLITVPLSTAINWEREFELWAPEMYIVTYTGDKASRCVIREHEFSFDEKAMGMINKPSKMKNNCQTKFHVLLTSYELVSIDSACLKTIDWSVLVVDEAHRLRNSESRFFKTLCQYKIDHIVLLTGTPLQNNLEELFHLMNFLSPKEFCNLENFKNEFSDMSKDAQVSKLHDLLGPHLLRRLKTDVLKGMPSKKELIVRVELSKMQKKYYRYILTRNYQALKVKGGGSMSLLNIVMDLKKCCNHPFLLQTAAQEAKTTPAGYYEGKELIESCGKLDLLSKMLRKLKEQDHRVLIFSQMTKLLDILEDFLEYEGYRYERIDGGITGQLRQDAIDRFNAPGAAQFVFLLSTRAGGLGINLATADTVIIYDSDWNPHNDIQAFSRAHRIGQSRKVMIYRFVNRSTVEERIIEVAKKKMMLTHLVVSGVGGGSTKSTGLTKKELSDILKFGAEDLFKDDDETPTTNGAPTNSSTTPTGITTSLKVEDVENNKEGDNASNGQPSTSSTNLMKTSGKIVYDNQAIDRLLNRNILDNEDVDESQGGINDYFKSFTVAQFNIEHPEEEIKIEEPNYQDYWDKLLREHYERQLKEDNEKQGKGKRTRRNVNYRPNQNGNGNDLLDDGTSSTGNVKNDNDSDVDVDHFSDENTDDESDDEDMQRRRRRNRDKLPPLLSKVEGHYEVYGFNVRQRRAFSNAIARFGLSLVDFHKYLGRDLRGKCERDLKAYLNMFLRHLCEMNYIAPSPPSSVNGEKEPVEPVFSDGVPREQLNCQLILNRIGLMSLIRKKVDEYKSINGFIPIVPKYPLKYLVCETTKTESESQENGNKEDGENETIDDETTIQKKEFMFNICDGGFTDLHSMWEKEVSDATPWKRVHDYWLLVAVSVHGLGTRWHEMLEDNRFEMLHEVLPSDFHPSTTARIQHDQKVKFLNRRFKVLEQALAVEDQLRRINYSSTFYQEKLLNENLPPNSLMCPTEQLNFNEVLKDDSVFGLSRRFAFLESIIDSNQHIAKEDPLQNLCWTKLLINAFQMIDRLLTEMKNDLQQLPAKLATITDVTERLNINTTSILALMSNDEDKKHHVTPYLDKTFRNDWTEFCSPAIIRTDYEDENNDVQIID